MSAPTLALALSLVLAACTTSQPGLLPLTDVTVSGEVVSVDLEPMAYDGNAVLVLRTDAGERRVEIPARTNLCQADGLDVALSAQPGQRLTVTGTAVEENGTITPCELPSHSVRRG